MLMRAKLLFSQKAELLLYPGCLVNAFKLDTLPHINIMYSWYCGMPKGTIRAKVTSNSEKIKPVALAVIELHLSEGIRQSVSRKFC